VGRDAEARRTFAPGITAGPDGNVWFTELRRDVVGRITPSGTITEFALPTTNRFEVGISAGPDGNVWFAESSGNKIGRITPSGTITEHRLRSFRAEPQRVRVP
jgi:virginiamycin B lyase